MYTLDVTNMPLDVTDRDVCTYETKNEDFSFQLNLYSYCKPYSLYFKILNSMKYNDKD